MTFDTRTWEETADARRATLSEREGGKLHMWPRVNRRLRIQEQPEKRDAFKKKKKKKYSQNKTWREQNEDF